MQPLLTCYPAIRAPQVRQLLLDPSVNREFSRLRAELEEKAREVKGLQQELQAVNFSQDSKTGRMLMAKCRTLQVSAAPCMLLVIRSSFDLSSQLVPHPLRYSVVSVRLTTTAVIAINHGAATGNLQPPCLLPRTRTRRWGESWRRAKSTPWSGVQRWRRALPTTCGGRIPHWRTMRMPSTGKTRTCRQALETACRLLIGSAGCKGTA